MNKKPTESAQEIEVSQKRCNEGVNKWLKAPQGWLEFHLSQHS